jgi:hypothetical protein
MKDNSIYGKSDNFSKYAKETNLRGSNPHELRKQWSGLKSPKKPVANAVDNSDIQNIEEPVSLVYPTLEEPPIVVEHTLPIELEPQPEKPIIKKKIEFMQQLNDDQDEVTKI